MADLIARDAHTELLPTSKPRHLKINTAISRPGMNWVYIFCASCGADGGCVLENDYDFAFYLCQPCADKYGEIAGTMMVPDEVFWEKVVHAQVEKYGRVLTPGEVAVQLDDATSMLSKLVKEKR